MSESLESTGYLFVVLGINAAPICGGTSKHCTAQVAAITTTAGVGEET